MEEVEGVVVEDEGGDGGDVVVVEDGVEDEGGGEQRGVAAEHVVGVVVEDGVGLVWLMILVVVKKSLF